MRALDRKKSGQLTRITKRYFDQGEINMPYVNIKITDENVTTEQKQALIRGTTQLLVDVLNKNPATTFVVIDEVSTDNWGIGFDQVTKLRQLTDK
jgi:4-oxalocrotonate tautomerase